MVLNDIGKIVLEEWSNTAILRSNVEIDECVIMPNHFHGIILILDNAECRGIALCPYEFKR